VVGGSAVPPSGRCACAVFVCSATLRYISQCLEGSKNDLAVESWQSCWYLEIRQTSLLVHGGCQHLIRKFICVFDVSPKLDQKQLAPPFCDTSFGNSPLSDTEQAPGGQNGRRIRTAQGTVCKIKAVLRNNPSYEDGDLGASYISECFSLLLIKQEATDGSQPCLPRLCRDV
jgi:hypothetical protein